MRYVLLLIISGYVEPQADCQVSMSATISLGVRLFFLKNLSLLCFFDSTIYRETLLINILINNIFNRANFGNTPEAGKAQV